MLDDVAFTAEMVMLQERFGRRALTTEVRVRYFEFLVDHLDTREFQAAARQIFNHDTYWPSPQRFIDAVRGDSKQLADSEWQEVMRLASNGSHNLASLTDRAAAALKSAGGMRAVMTAEGEFSLEQKRKRFTDAYQAVTATRPPGLPEKTVHPVLPGLGDGR